LLDPCGSKARAGFNNCRELTLGPRRSGKVDAELVARDCVHAKHLAFDIAGAVVGPDHGKLGAAQSGDGGLILVARLIRVDQYLVHRAAPLQSEHVARKNRGRRVQRAS
jgi:hypothetical protein